MTDDAQGLYSAVCQECEKQDFGVHMAPAVPTVDERESWIADHTTTYDHHKYRRIPEDGQGRREGKQR